MLPTDDEAKEFEKTIEIPTFFSILKEPIGYYLVYINIISGKNMLHKIKKI